jgi:hypothetical protein
MDLVIYIFSWKKVSSNAIILYEEISKVYDKVWLLNCEENLNIPDKNIIQADDSYYFTKQFYTCLNHLKNTYDENHAFMNVVGDVKPGADWKNIIQRIKYGFDNLNCGIVAPNVDFTSWNENLEEYTENYWFVKNTDCTAWALHPSIVNFMVQNGIENFTHFGWGIDWICIEFCKKMGMNTLRDCNNIVYQPQGTGYSSDKAEKEFKKIRLLWYGKYAKI